MANPTIRELQNEERFDLLAEVSHKEIKEFVVKQLTSGGNLVRIYMIYQGVMILTGSVFLILSVIAFFRGYKEPLLICGATLVFCFSLLIVIHELLHGIALKLSGAKKVSFGGYLKKFVFYAEADQTVFNRKQFAFIALTPLFVIKLLTVAGIILLFNSPFVYFFIIVMSAHSLFCAGDIGLLSIFHTNGKEEIFTYDEKKKKTSYYYQRKAARN